MIPASDPRDRIKRTAWPRRGPLVKRRASFGPELETVEDRCLLSSYSVTDMTFPGGYLIEAAAINNLGQVAGRGSAPNFASAVIWQNGSIVPLDPQPNGIASAGILLDRNVGVRNEPQGVRSRTLHCERRFLAAAPPKADVTRTGVRQTRSTHPIT